MGGPHRPGRYPRLRRLVPRPPTTTAGGSALAASVFGAAPRALAGVINLQQTVDLVRLSIEVVESNIDEIARPGRRTRRPRGGAPLRPGGRLRDRRGLRPRRRGPRRVGRPARGARRRRRAALRRRRGGAVAGQRARLGGQRRRGGRGGRRTRSAHGDRPLRRGTPRGSRGAGWTRCAPPRANASWSCWAACTTRARPPRPWSTCSATGRWWSARWPRDLSRRLRARRAPRCPLTDRPPAGPTPRDPCAATTCCPSARWPATATPGDTWSRTSTCRCCGRAAR